MKKKRKRDAPEQIVKKLRDADVMLNTGKSPEEVLKVLEVSEATLARWRSQYGGMKSEEAKRLKELEGENARLKRLLAEAELEQRLHPVSDAVHVVAGHGAERAEGFEAPEHRDGEEAQPTEQKHRDENRIHRRSN